MVKTHKDGERLVNLPAIRQHIHATAKLAAKKEGVTLIRFIEGALSNDPSFKAALKEQLHGNSKTITNGEGRNQEEQR